MKFSYRFPKIFSFHQETKRPMHIPSDESLWPARWKTVEYKEYPRFSSLKLPKPVFLEKGFSSVVMSRQSGRVFEQKELSLEELSSFLFWSFGEKRNIAPDVTTATRVHPSGGGRYPLEVYFFYRGGTQLKAGMYHYNIKKHTIEYLLGDEISGRVNKIPNYPFTKEAPFVAYVTGIPERSMRKYAERGYRFTVLEAGAVLAHAYLTAAALDMSICAIGVNQDDEISEILDLDPEEEVLLYAFVLGHKAS